MLTILLACLAMVARDAAVEFNTIAQVKGRARLSMVLSPITTVTGMVVTVLGVGPVIQHGITPHSAAVIGAILLTDALDGEVFTRLGRRIKTEGGPLKEAEEPGRPPPDSLATVGRDRGK